jgi:hypothetical protein
LNIFRKGTKIANYATMINMAKADRTMETKGMKYILTLQYQIQYSLFNK